MSLIKQTLQFAAVVVQNLPEMSGKAMQRYIDDPAWLQTVLGKALRVFRTIKLGTDLLTIRSFFEAFESSGCLMDDWSRDMLRHYSFKISDQSIKVDLMILTPAELGFKQEAPYSDICQRAMDQGYSLCPAEVGPQLRLQYRNQPKGEVLCIAMEPVSWFYDDVHTVAIFAVERNSAGLWLRGCDVNPRGLCRTDTPFVFVCSK